MFFSSVELIVILLIVFLVATVFSIVGLGGALIYVPLFYWMGIPLPTAIPTALFLNCITTGSASVTFYKEKMIALGFAYPLIVTSVLFAPLGAYANQFLDDNIILALFSIVLIIAGIWMFIPVEPKSMIPKKNTLIAGTSGIVIGFAAGLLGIGGGVLAVPLLILLGFKAKNASATSAVFVFFTSLSGLLGHVGVGSIDPEIMIFTGIAVFIGARAGSGIMVSHLESRMVMKIFGVILLVIAAKIIYHLA